ncbi:MAG TPA: hypothetical protein DCZ63_15105 [Geobacter sp.]|nr:hypothetical protein [Geobacter sp.]
MNKAIQRAHQILDAIPSIPGYTGDEGEIIITIGQHKGSARTVDVVFSTVEKLSLNNGSLQRVKKKRMNIANLAT